MTAKTETAKADTASTDEKDMSKAEQERMAEFRRTRKVPSGYTYNVWDGLHKTPKKDK